MDFNTNTQKLKDIFELAPLNMTKQLESFKEEDALHKTTYNLKQKNYIFGIEIELENYVNEYIKSQHRSYWTSVPDGSLRNHGIEFVSLPLKAYQIEKALTQLHQGLAKNVVEFSERTSVHIHMNVRDLTFTQLLGLVLIYTSVEPMLFKWVGHNRNRNTFCIPLLNTDFYKLYRSITIHPRSITRHWMKYTALNLLPIGSKGTVEFRHLYGNMDKQVILTWIELLSQMKFYTKTHTLQEITKTISELNTNSLYTEYVSDIFKENAKLLLSNTDNIQDDLEHAITYCKLASCKENY